MLSSIADEHLALFARPGKAGLIEYDGLDDAIATRDGNAPRYEHANTEKLYQSLIATTMTSSQAVEIMEMYFATRDKGAIQHEQFQQLIFKKSEFAKSQFRTGAGPKHPAFLLKSHLSKLTGETKSALPATNAYSSDQLTDLLKYKRNQLYDAIKPLEAIAKAYGKDDGDKIKDYKWALATKVAEQLDEEGDLSLESFRNRIDTISENNAVA